MGEILELAYRSDDSKAIIFRHTYPRTNVGGPLFFQFLKDCFSLNSDRIETARLVFFQHPLQTAHHRGS